MARPSTRIPTLRIPGTPRVPGPLEAALGVEGSILAAVSQDDLVKVLNAWEALDQSLVTAQDPQEAYARVSQETGVPLAVVALIIHGSPSPGEVLRPVPESPQGTPPVVVTEAGPQVIPESLASLLEDLETLERALKQGHLMARQSWTEGHLLTLRATRNRMVAHQETQEHLVLALRESEKHVKTLQESVDALLAQVHSLGVTRDQYVTLREYQDLSKQYEDTLAARDAQGEQTLRRFEAAARETVANLERKYHFDLIDVACNWARNKMLHVDFYRDQVQALHDQLDEEKAARADAELELQVTRAELRDVMSEMDAQDDAAERRAALRMCDGWADHALSLQRDGVL